MNDWREEMTRKLQKDYDRGYQNGIDLLDIPEADLENDWYMNGYWKAREEWEEDYAFNMRSEARAIAERINRARFKGNVPSADDTVRLCELLDILCEEEA